MSLEQMREAHARCKTSLNGGGECFVGLVANTHCILPSVTTPTGKLAAGMNLVEMPSDLCPDG